MPKARAKKTARIVRSTVKASSVSAGLSNSFPAFPVDSKKLLSKKYLISAAVVLVLALLIWRNKTLFVVATVNGQPVPRWDLENRLVSRYGSQTLDEVINEALIRQAGQKAGVKVLPADIDKKIAEVEKSLNGQITLADALTQQGMTMAEFRNQVELQLTLDKLAGSSVVVTDQEVADYIASNNASLSTTDPASQSAEARQALTSQKQNAAYSQLFKDLKTQAKIVKYL